MENISEDPSSKLGDARTGVEISRVCKLHRETRRGDQKLTAPIGTSHCFVRFKATSQIMNA